MNQKPIRIIRIIPDLTARGMTSQAILTCSFLKRKGYESLLLAAPTPSGFPSADSLLVKEGVSPVQLSSLTRKNIPRYWWKAIWDIKHAIHDFKPQIMHTHDTLPGFLGRIAARHCQRLLCFHTWHHTPRYERHGSVNGAMMRKLEKWISRRTERILVYNQAAADEIIGNHLATPEKVCVMTPGYDLERFRSSRQYRAEFRSQLGFSDSDYVTGLVSRFTPEKRPLELLQVAAKIGERLPEARFVLVGQGPLLNEMQKFIDEHKLHDKVKILPFTENPEQIYGGVDQTISCAVDEGMPASMVESLAAGTPALGTDHGYCNDLKVLAWPVGTYSPGDLEQIIVDLIEGSRYRDKYAARARESKQEVITRYHIQPMINHLDEIYRRALETCHLHLGE